MSSDYMRSESQETETKMIFIGQTNTEHEKRQDFTTLCVSEYNLHHTAEKQFFFILTD